MHTLLDFDARPIPEVNGLSLAAELSRTARSVLVPIIGQPAGFSALQYTLSNARHCVLPFTSVSCHFIRSNLHVLELNVKVCLDDKMNKMKPAKAERFFLYGQVEAAIAQALTIMPEGMGALRGRLRHLRNIGFPHTAKPGSG